MNFDSDRLTEIFSTLSRNKLRTALTAFGVFWGIFMLIIMLGSGNGLSNGVMQMFSGEVSNAVYIWTQNTSIPYKGLPRNRQYNFENADIDAIRKQVAEVDVLAPANQLGGYRGESNVVHGNKTGPFIVRGDFPEIRSINSFRISAGRFINYNDIHEKRKVCVIGEQVKDVLFAREDPVGQSLKINGIYFEVLGVYGVDKAGEDAQERMQTIYTPFTTFQQAFNWGDKISWITMTPKIGIDASFAEEKVKTLLRARHKIAPGDVRAIGSWNTEKEFKKITGLFTGIRILVWIVGSGTLLAGVIGVSNIMLIIVRERTREIGIRRAIGATPASVMTQVMLESIFLTSVAGYFGLVCGIGVLELVDHFLQQAPAGMFSQPGVDINTAVKALGILVASGAVAGIIPARHAASVPPVEALRAD
jgi:putative ABC transport system permease protein